MIGCAETDHDGWHVVARIAVGDVAAERADVAHLWIGNLQRGFAQYRNLRGQQVGADQFVLGCHRADDDVAAVAAGAFEVGDAGEINKVRRTGKAQLHHGDEAMSAGERAAVVA
jgi:hypothetical protein